MKYKTNGVCSTEIDFEVDGDVLTKLEYKKGCNGNLSGISKLVIGMKIDEIISKLEGTKCDDSGTSCPDQLAKALQAYKNNK